MAKVLIISNDVVAADMAGVGMRYWEIAHALASGGHSIVLAAPNPAPPPSDTVQVVSYDLEGGDLRPWLKGVDVIVLQGNILHFHPYLRDTGIPLAVDLYVPHLLESLVWHDKDEWKTWIPAYEEYLRIHLELLRAGDFFFCASERQRDYWLGWLHAQKRINPHTYRDDPSLRRLIDVVPIGLPKRAPQHSRAVLKGVVEGISLTDKVVLWSGGLWDWLDPLTLIRAMGHLRDTHPEIKLYFMGALSPNRGGGGMQMPDAALRLSKSLKLYGVNVFFGAWVPYSERENYLLEADISAVLYPEHIETHFAVRTRALDCIWARLPLVVSPGDVLSDWVERYELGEVLSRWDDVSLADAILSVVEKGKDYYAGNFAPLIEKFQWENAVRPLREFCRMPRLAPDKGQYLTELERICRDKDAFLEQVVADKDAFLAQVIADKDAFFARTVAEKDALLAQTVVEKDAVIARYQHDLEQWYRVRSALPLWMHKLGRLYLRFRSEKR